MSDFALPSTLPAVLPSATAAGSSKSAGSRDPDKVHDAAQQFEALLMGQILRGARQSGSGWLPDMFPEATVERALAAAPLGTRILLKKDGEPIAGVPMHTPVTIALGPEGGMEPAERDLFIGAAFLPVKLGSSTLRFETAGVAAVAIAAASQATSRQSNV